MNNQMQAATPPTEPPPRMARLAIPTHRVLVTWLLIAINVVLWILMELNGGSQDSQTLIAFGAKVNALINEGEVWRLFTAMFLHIGIFHLAINGYSLYNVGSILERFIGSARFVALYLLAGLCGSLGSYIFSPFSISAGASGAIFGLLGGLGVFFFLHRALFGAAANSILVNILVVAAINLGLGLSLPGIDNFAHAGGLLGGIVVGALIVPRYRVRADSFGAPYVGADNSRLGWLLLLLFALALVGGTALAVQRVSDSAAAHLQRGQEFYDAEQFAEASSELNLALLRDPQSFAAAFYLGAAHFQQREYTEAASAFEKAVMLQPDAAEARFNLALSYIRLRQYSDARTQLQAYMQLPDIDRAEAEALLSSIAGK